jgi:hypothetical protein
VNAPPTELWPWLALAGLGLFHGINPAMGWLFAVALGLHRSNQRTVLLSLLPIAAGHAAAVAAMLLAVLALGVIVDGKMLIRLSGFVLIGWAGWHALYGHRRKVLVGMQAGFAGLVLWSFLMASSHGAGLMLIPLLAPICASASIQTVDADGAIPLALAALGVHSAAMLATIGMISLLVYNFVGVDFLRRGWINVDLIWIVALALCGVTLLAT